MKPDAYDIKSKIGVVFQDVAIFEELTVYDNIDYFCGLYIKDKKLRKQYIEDAIELVGLEEFKKFYPKQLSGGLLRRLNIACGIAHKPKLIFLDEPTVALDPQVRRRIWDLIRRLPKDGVTVVLTTHYIEEAENLCNRVAILNKGSLIKLDTPKALCEQIGKYVVEWDSEESREYKFFNSRKECADFAGTLDVATTIRHSNLEDVFVELTGRTVS